MDAYRSQMTHERLGWVIFRSPDTFMPAHRVHMHPEDGPVIIVADRVLEVDPETDAVYRTEQEARDAYWEGERTP